MIKDYTMRRDFSPQGTACRRLSGNSIHQVCCYFYDNIHYTSYLPCIHNTWAEYIDALVYKSIYFKIVFLPKGSKEVTDEF